MEEEKILKFDSIGKDVAKYIRKEKKLAFSLDEDDSDDVEVLTTLVKGALEAIGDKLHDEKSKEEAVSVEIEDLMKITVSWRENDEGKGNWGLGIEAGEGLKKMIKKDKDKEEE